MAQPIAPADRRMLEARDEHERERQAYLATLDPRQRLDLDPDSRRAASGS